MTPTWRVLEGDCVSRLRELDAGSVHTCVTSPPYFGLRDYGTAEWEGGDPSCDHTPRMVPRADRPASGPTGGTATVDAGTVRRGDCPECGARRVDRQIGLEPTPDEFVAALVDVVREVRRVLRDDGTVWLNLGDSYASAWACSRRNVVGQGSLEDGRREARPNRLTGDLKEKDLIGIPWMVAFALRADGWYLRSDVIWSKPNPMPESVTDRPTKAHEYVFLLSKAPRYFYDADAIREPAEVHSRPLGITKQGGEYETLAGRNDGDWPRSTTRGFGAGEAGRNKRSVWTVATQPYAGAHFATFPPNLVEPCILAGCPEGGTVLDPFAGSGTTGMVALRHGRSFVGVELNPIYAALARGRIISDAPLLNSHAEVA